MSYKVVVKWNKKTFDVELDASQPPPVFKMQLYSLTSVPPDKQKIMIKGGVLKDETDWATVGLKDGFSFMMMGTPGEAPPIIPTNTTKFIEDMTEDELSKATDTPAGLVNLGNTCYLNATLQCLKSIPEFSKSLISYQSSGSDASNNLTAGCKSLFNELANSGKVTPLVFVMLLRALFPQFDQQERGVHMQQDAEECWGQIVSTIGQKLKDKDSSFVDKYFGIELTSTWKCEENPSEPLSYTQERMNKLQCHITNEVNNLNQGISETLTEKVEKNSPSLNRTTIYSKTSRISYLPSYLTVNFVRFFWRKDTQKKTKILRKVAFPMEFDAYEFCTEDLKQKLVPKRQQLADYDRKRMESKMKDSTEEKAPEYQPITGENTTGFYELTAVLTHIGRSSDSGHYMAWVKKDKDSWWKFDDDKVSLVSADEIKKLDGGGDWHMAYICIYSEKKIPVTNN